MFVIFQDFMFFNLYIFKYFKHYYKLRINNWKISFLKLIIDEMINEPPVRPILIYFKHLTFDTYYVLGESV